MNSTQEPEKEQRKDQEEVKEKEITNIMDKETSSKEEGTTAEKIT